jgi:hypothetical protein
VQSYAHKDEYAERWVHLWQFSINSYFSFENINNNNFYTSMLCYKKKILTTKILRKFMLRNEWKIWNDNKQIKSTCLHGHSCTFIYFF